jgi:hypothetical protein
MEDGWMLLVTAQTPTVSGTAKDRGNALGNIMKTSAGAYGEHPRVA